MSATTMTQPSRADHAGATFPADRRSPASARRFVTDRLAGWGWVDDEVVEVAQLLVSELVSNGVLHAGTPVGVSVGCDGRSIAVAVTDGVPGGIEAGPWPTRHPRGAPSGRGLRIVDALADDWGVSVHDQGKTIWFELRPETLAG